MHEVMQETNTWEVMAWEAAKEMTMQEAVTWGRDRERAVAL